MKFGLCLPNFPFGVHPSREAIVGVALEAEKLGFDSVWATDHILVPKDRPRFNRLFESLSTLAYLGGMTQKIQLGTSVLVLPFRNAIVVAKQAATLDALTGGRLIIAVGVGSIEREYEMLGVDFHRRGRLLNEQMSVLRTLWSEDDPRMEGEFYQFADVLFEPRPAQAKGIPIWVGGNSEAAMGRAARLGDAWHADELLEADLLKGMQKIQAMSNGREVGLTVRRTIDLRPALAATRQSGGQALERWPGAAEIAMTGSLERVLAEMDGYARIGLQHFVCQFEHQSQEEHLEQMRFFAREIFPRFHN